MATQYFFKLADIYQRDLYKLEMQTQQELNYNICKEIDQFLKQYKRQVIQLKTLKQKLEESTDMSTLFKKQQISISQMKDAIMLCDMKQFLDDKTLNNYQKDKKQISLVQQSQSNQQVTDVQQSNEQTPQKQKPNKVQKQTTQQSNAQKALQIQNNQAGFNKYLQDFSIHILEREEQQYKELIIGDQEQTNAFSSIFAEYCLIFAEDKYLLQQRLLTDLENIQLYINSLQQLSKNVRISDFYINENDQFNYNLPYQIIYNAIIQVKNNQSSLQNDTLDMNYPSFSQYVQKELDSIKNKLIESNIATNSESSHSQQDWQMSIIQNFTDLIIKE